MSPSVTSVLSELFLELTLTAVLFGPSTVFPFYSSLHPELAFSLLSGWRLTLFIPASWLPIGPCSQPLFPQYVLLAPTLLMGRDQPGQEAWAPGSCTPAQLASLSSPGAASLPLCLGFPPHPGGHLPCPASYWVTPGFWGALTPCLVLGSFLIGHEGDFFMKLLQMESDH